MKVPKDLLDLLRRYDRGIQELTLALREVVLEELAPCFENIIEVYIISIMYSSTEKMMKTGICYIGVLKDHVNLGFQDGASLRDPYGLIEGTGKRMRHVKIRHINDVLNPAIRSYLQEAAERAGHDSNGAERKTVTTSVKRKNAEKRVIGTTRI